MIEPIGRARLTLRRYADGPCPNMPGQHGYHNAEAPLFDVDERKDPTGSPGDWVYKHDGPQRLEDVPPEYAFPTHCACGFAFPEKGGQIFSVHLYRRVDNGEVRTHREWVKVPGAMWNAEWLARYPHYCGPDGLALTVVCPNGQEWSIDGRCSNCTMPEDMTHKCWVRHGVPPLITVDKDGVTCAAGAGSIQAGDYHGFLRNGEFT
jgi:hypothetical protein